jgi:membrane-associated protein
VDWLLEWLIGFASDRNHPLGFAVLFGSALLEYVVPPFPGDTITLFGAVLITGYGWSPIALPLVVVLGSVAGSLFDYWIGLKLRARPRPAAPSERRAALDRLIARFERRGPIYLVVNRFLPGVRAFFFVAAGMAGMSLRDVLLYGGISVVLWNAMLIAVGAALGANLDSLVAWFHRYTTVSWIALGSAAALWITFHLVATWRARRRKRGLKTSPDGGSERGAHVRD